MTAQPHSPLTLAEFPRWKSQQESKHEFIDGHVYGVAAGSVSHNRLSTLLLEMISPAARPYRTFGSDMLIAMAAGARYADIIVNCDERHAIESASRITSDRFPEADASSWPIPISIDADALYDTVGLA